MARQAVLAALMVVCLANAVVARDLLAEVHKSPKEPEFKEVADDVNERRFAIVRGGPKRHLLADVAKAPNKVTVKSVSDTAAKRFAVVNGGDKRHLLADVAKAPNKVNVKSVPDNAVEQRFAFINRVGAAAEEP